MLARQHRYTLLASVHPTLTSLLVLVFQQVGKAVQNAQEAPTVWVVHVLTVSAAVSTNSS